MTLAAVKKYEEEQREKALGAISEQLLKASGSVHEALVVCMRKGPTDILSLSFQVDKAFKELLSCHESSHYLLGITNASAASGLDEGD